MTDLLEVRKQDTTAPRLVTSEQHDERHSSIPRSVSCAPRASTDPGTPQHVGACSTNLLTPLQLDTLRSAIPTLVSPLIKPQTSKGQMFAQVKKSAVITTSQLAAFRDDWNSEQTQQILATAQESEQKDPDLSKVEEVARFGWNDDYEKENS